MKFDVNDAVKYLQGMVVQCTATEAALREWKPEEADGYAEDANRYAAMQAMMMEYQRVVSTAIPHTTNLSARIGGGQSYWLLKGVPIDGNIRDSLSAAIYNGLHNKE